MYFKKILIANRGEIAVRICKACKELGITSAVPYSEADKLSLHVRVADEAYNIGGSTASESYLDANKILTLAKNIGADAIHPGYGFMSENPDFILQCEKSGITFIGPASKSVKLMGEKTSARRLMKENNVPVVPGTTKPVNTIEEAMDAAMEIGFPIMLKAAAGGGGKGMRLVRKENELANSLERAKHEALKAFSNEAVYIEKYIENPKHIEVQIIGDKHGNYRHLFERECSIQRRHQKIIEESPSPSVDEITRNKITEAAIMAAKACGYYNAGTIEFLMDSDKNFYFLEMNTRLQVEHPVSELVSGIDLVREQIKIAAGEKIGFEQSDLKLLGHAIECRVYAEDTDNNFAPSTGTILHHRLPSGPGIRIDRGIDVKSEVSVYYDPMLSKVISFDKNRETAIKRMQSALSNYQIAGVTTNINVLIWILQHRQFKDGTFTINFIESELLPLLPVEWKKELNSQFIDYSAIVGALFKKQNNNFQIKKNECQPDNKWSEQNNE